MDLEIFLRSTGIHYEKPLTRRDARTRRPAAAAPSTDGVSAKAVLVKGQLGYAVCVWPSPCNLNLEWVAEVMQEFDVQLAADDEADGVFRAVEYMTCPAGTCGCRTRLIMDARLQGADLLVIQNGNPANVVRVRRCDWERRLKPIVAEIAEAA
jgi:prolyl-tRNA editing enzyme YbaK/EbsC (Cys-tRNA(Pro) deacylase)